MRIRIQVLEFVQIPKFTNLFFPRSLFWRILDTELYWIHIRSSINPDPRRDCRIRLIRLLIQNTAYEALCNKPYSVAVSLFAERTCKKNIFLLPFLYRTVYHELGDLSAYYNLHRLGVCSQRRDGGPVANLQLPAGGPAVAAARKLPPPPAVPPHCDLDLANSSCAFSRLDFAATQFL
jgi:hypothetical protein